MPILTATYTDSSQTTIKASNDNGSDLFIPNDADNRHYKEVQKWVADGGVIAAYVEPAETSEAESKRLKLEGVSIGGVMCSATSQDMWGLSSVRAWVESGQNVNFKFDNDNELLLTSANLAAFEAIWIPFRASFF